MREEPALGVDPTGQSAVAHLQVCRQRRLRERIPWEKEEGKWEKGQKDPHPCLLLAPSQFRQTAPWTSFIIMSRTETRAPVFF